MIFGRTLNSKHQGYSWYIIFRRAGLLIFIKVHAKLERTFFFDGGSISTNLAIAIKKYIIILPIPLINIGSM